MVIDCIFNGIQSIIFVTLITFVCALPLLLSTVCPMGTENLLLSHRSEMMERQ